MKVLVTGATGFVGRHLVSQLTAEGHAVRAFVRSVEKSDILKESGVEIVVGDILDRESLEKSVIGCEQVYHLAGQTSRQRITKQAMYAANVEGTRNVCQAAANAGVARLIHASSVGVYGVVKQPPADETTEARPNTAYRRSKLMAEAVVMEHSQTLALPMVIARLSSALGAGCLSWLGLSQAIATGHFRLVGNGHNYFHVSHVSDVVAGLMLCAQTPKAEGNVYVIAGGEPIQMKDLVREIARSLNVSTKPYNLPKAPFQLFFSLSQLIDRASHIEMRRAHQYEIFLKSRLLNIAKAQTDINYRPKISASAAIKETVEWYKSEGKL